jgi:two-component system cell cycle response regulator
MTRAKTQHGSGGKPPRAPTQSGGKSKRAATNGLFNELEAAIDALDADTSYPPKHAGARTEAARADDKVERPPAPKIPLPPPKRTAPGPTPAAAAAASPSVKPFPPRSSPSKPPPAAERPAAIRAREARARSEIGAVEAEVVNEKSAPVRGPAARPTPPTRPPANVTRPPAVAEPRTAPPRPPPGSQPAPIARAESDDFSSIGSSIDIDFEESSPAAQAYKAYESGPTRAISEHARAISVGETAAEDLVIEGEDLPPIKPLSIAVFEDPPQVAAAKQAIIVVGHKVAAAASGGAGIEQIKSLLRSGSAEVLLVGVPGGEALIDTALALAPRRPVVIAVSAGTGVEAARRAASFGADLSIVRPISADGLAPVLLAATRLAAERNTATAARGSETMLRARLDALVEPEPGALQPFELFQRVLELELKRSKRYGYPIAVALFALDVGPEEPPPGVRGIMKARAGNALIHSIRDIDLATEVDQERFLVLLPYTSLAGAAEVARRIIHAVTSGNPITASGRTFPPKVIGAVAGALPGQPLSFSRLMRDAMQALEQAKRDGAELAVPMVRGPQ